MLKNNKAEAKKEEKTNKELVAVYLYSHEKAWLEQQAQEDKRSVSDYARLVLTTKMPQQK